MATCPLIAAVERFYTDPSQFAAETSQPNCRIVRMRGSRHDRTSPAAEGGESELYASQRGRGTVSGGLLRGALPANYL